jgi:hypothetical protein
MPKNGTPAPPAFPLFKWAARLIHEAHAIIIRIDCTGKEREVRGVDDKRREGKEGERQEVGGDAK